MWLFEKSKMIQDIENPKLKKNMVASLKSIEDFLEGKIKRSFFSKKLVSYEKLNFAEEKTLGKKEGLEQMGQYLGSLAKGEMLAEEIGNARMKRFEDPRNNPQFEKE